jgi:2-oxoglutarate ferredoxin oxidoreductase subunit beta
VALKASDFRTEVHNDWCPGCGDFGILSAVQMALADLARPRNEIAIVSGIGCSGKSFQYINTYGVHTLHGRLLPFATGVKLANPDLEVIAVGGDGDGLGIGAGHFVNSGRRNLDIAYLFFNNSVYGLTKGQAAPTLKLGMKPKSLPKPNINESINPIALALSSGYTFVGRSYSYDMKHLKEMILKAINHKGFAFLDIHQPCPTYNDLNTKEWYAANDLVDKSGSPTSRLYNLDNSNFDGVVKDGNDSDEITEKMTNAFALSMNTDERLPLGVFYQNEHVPSYEERLSSRVPSYRSSPPGRQLISDSNGVPVANVSALFDELVMS